MLYKSDSTIMLTLILLVILMLAHQRHGAAAVSESQDFTCNSSKVDPLQLPYEWMNKDTARGPCVVQAVIDMINSSNIFEPDHGFLRRIAYAETKDGFELSNKTETDFQTRRVGIWGLSHDMLYHMSHEMFGKPAKYQLLFNKSHFICEEFGVNPIDYLNYTVDNSQRISNPLVSGLIARFYLSYVVTRDNTSLPSDLIGQKGFWTAYYKDDGGIFLDIGEGLCQCFDCTVEQWTTYENASGSCIVETILKQINDSGVFKEDHLLMRRIAYVETRDGREPVLESLGNNQDNRLGIWGVETIMISSMSEGMAYTYPKELSNMNKTVFFKFGIDIFSSEVMQQLRNPLVSAIVARFYLYYLTLVVQEPLPQNLNEQAVFWKEEYRDRDQVSRNINFTERVLEIEGCRVNADIVFVLDLSSSIARQLIKVKAFMIEFIRNLRIGPSDDRVGLIIFENDAHEVFNFSSNTNKSDMISAINNIERPRKGGTNIPEGLRLTSKMFNQDHRPLALRIAIVLSDGNTITGDDDDQAVMATIKEATSLHNVEPDVMVYSIGVPPENETMMRYIAENKASRYTHIYRYNKTEFSNTRDRYLRDICCYASAPLINSSENTSLSLNKGNIMRYTVRQITVNGITIKVCTSKGNVSIFASSQPLNGDSDNNRAIPFKCGQTHNDVCVCQEGFIGTRYPPVKSNHQTAKRDVTQTEYLISIEGVEDENIFTLEVIDEEAPIDCVGQEGGEECTEKPTSTPDESPSTHEETPSSLQSKKSKKNTIIIASVTSTGSFLTCCSVIVGVIIGWVAYRRQKKKKLQKIEEEKYVLLDSEYTEMQ